LTLERFDRRFMPKTKQYMNVDAEAKLTTAEELFREDDEAFAGSDAVEQGDSNE